MSDLIDDLIEAARLLGATQAKKGIGCYTREDARFERAMHESISDKAKRLTAERDELRKFVGRVLGEARQYMSDIDGGDVQAWAIECGLLEEWTATEPCGEQCECAEVADFPTRCYRLTDAGKAAIDAAKEQR